MEISIQCAKCLTWLQETKEAKYVDGILTMFVEPCRVCIDKEKEVAKLLFLLESKEGGKE